MAKTADRTRQDDVRSAICKIRDKFPHFSRHRDVSVLETEEIKKKIRDRELELEKDAKLVALQKQLMDVSVKVREECDKRRDEVESLLTRLSLRGVTEELIQDVEKMSKLKGYREV